MLHKNWTWMCFPGFGHRSKVTLHTHTISTNTNLLCTCIPYPNTQIFRNKSNLRHFPQCNAHTCMHACMHTLSCADSRSSLSLWSKNWHKSFGETAIQCLPPPFSVTQILWVAHRQIRSSKPCWTVHHSSRIYVHKQKSKSHTHF